MVLAYEWRQQRTCKETSSQNKELGLTPWAEFTICTMCKSVISPQAVGPKISTQLWGTTKSMLFASLEGFSFQMCFLFTGLDKRTAILIKSVK